MKRLFFALILASASLGYLAGLPKAAVLDIIAQKGIGSSVVVPVTESIMEEVVGTRAYVVLDRAYIEQVLKEQEFDISIMVRDTQVAKAGQYVGAGELTALLDMAHSIGKRLISGGPISPLEPSAAAAPGAAAAGSAAKPAAAPARGSKRAS
jgi:hypothetical protein